MITSYKETKGNFTVNQHCRYQLTQGIQVNIRSDGNKSAARHLMERSEHHGPRGAMQWEEHTIAP